MLLHVWKVFGLIGLDDTAPGPSKRCIDVVIIVAGLCLKVYIRRYVHVDACASFFGLHAMFTIVMSTD